jgi:hypothetical protein
VFHVLSLVEGCFRSCERYPFAVFALGGLLWSPLLCALAFAVLAPDRASEARRTERAVAEAVEAVSSVVGWMDVGVVLCCAWRWWAASWDGWMLGCFYAVGAPQQLAGVAETGWLSTVSGVLNL